MTGGVREQTFFADQKRRRSPEVDFGVWWHEAGTGRDHWHRVSWIEFTGELYAIDFQRGLCELLGTFDTREDVDAALEGWEDVCGKPRSLAWVRSRVPVSA